MIYRIHHNDDFLTFEIPTREVLDKLGRDYPFHINRTPMAYENLWNELHIVFRAPEKNSQEIIPDLAEVDGKLFLSQKAFRTLRGLLEGSGEFLPVTYDCGTGYIFNILNIAEDKNALDEKLVTYDEYENLTHFGFKEDSLKDTVIFRSKIDHFSGIFCTNRFKSAIEEAELTGIYLHTDLADFVGTSHSKETTS